MIGTTVSHYKILEKLGVGGMGVVYRAEDLTLGRHVALKFLPDALAEDPEALARFRREARAASALNHPHICTIHELGEEEGHPFIVMELMDGQTLKYRISDQPMPAEQIVQFGAQVADALEAAHGAGIVHRDLKPANLFVTGRGDAKVLDFGLAKVTEDEVRKMSSGAGAAEAATELAPEQLTSPGTAMGTIAYMSPEQVRGEELDARTDLFSLGVVLYEMATGKQAFQGKTAGAIFDLILNQAPTAPVRINPELPDELERILNKALEKDKTLRYQHASDLEADLNRLERDSASVQAAAVASHRDATPIRSPTADEPAAPAPVGSATPTMAARGLAPASRRRVVLAAAGLAIVAAVGWWGLRGRWPGTADESTSPAVPGSQASIAVLPFADLSPDRASTYLGDGVAETISTALSKVPGLTITARTSAFALRDEAADVREIGRQLGVAHVLTGSIQRAGDQLRIAARVVRAENDSILWSDVFDRPASDIFAVQDEVARAVAAALQLALSRGPESTRATGGTENTAAYDAYLLGRYHWNRRTTDGMVRATAAFQKAIDADPNYAQAWSGLADAYSLSVPGEFNVPGIDPEATLALAEEAARKAIALAPELGEGHTSLGEALAQRQQYAEAMAAFERGIALSPSYATGHQWYSYALLNVNRWDEGIREMEIAHRLDPLAHIITLSLAIAYDGADRFAEATPLYAQGLGQSPEAWYAWTMRFGHDLALGQLDEAAVALRTGLHGTAFGVTGDRSTMVQLADEWSDPATRGRATEAIIRTGEPAAAVALARWLDGEAAAIETIEAIVRDGRGKSITLPLAVYAILGPKLSVEPRVQAASRQLGFPPIAEERMRR